MVGRGRVKGRGLKGSGFKNIGKDMSKIAMPVALNEPLRMLQVGVGKLLLVSDMHTYGGVGYGEMLENVVI